MMDDIPEDVMETAWKVVYSRDWESDAGSALKVAKSIMDERERCTAICENPIRTEFLMDDGGTVVGLLFCSKEHARRVREGYSE